MSVKHYEVIVVGGGISGAALFFELAKYSDIIFLFHIKIVLNY
jgi:malate dehydrogenase (quinone)